MGASNLHYHQWERNVALARETTFGTAATTPKTWPVLGPPRVNINPNQIDTGETGRGRSERSKDEFANGNIDSGSVFETRGAAVFLYELLCTLLQVRPAGVETPASSGFFKHTFGAYTAQPATNLGFTFWDSWRAGASGHGKRSVGNIARSIGWNSTAEQIVRMPVETQAVNADRTALASTPASTWSSPLLLSHHQMLLAEIDNAALAPTPTQVNLQLVNNLVPHRGNTRTPSELVLGIFNITGSLQLSTRTDGDDMLQKFLDEATVKMEFGWGTVLNQTGYVEFIFDARYTGNEDVDLNGIQGMNLPFSSALNDTSPTTTTVNIWHSANLAA